MFLLGVFFWKPTVRAATEKREADRMSEGQALSLASYELMSHQQRRISIPKRFSIPMREMLSLQPRFMQTKGKRALKLIEHRRFRAAYDFMMLRAEVGDFDPELAEFWTNVQTVPEPERAERFHLSGPTKKKRRSRNRRRRKPAED